MNDDSPIPIPPQQQWREFRIRRIPVIGFVVVLCAVVFIWRNQVSTPNLVGEVEVIRSDVISTLPGMVAEIYVDRLEQVTQGQPVAKIYPADPELLKANLAAVEMEIKLLRTRVALDERRNEFDYENLRLDWLNKKVELATAEVNLQYEESELQRIARLWEDKIESQSAYEMAKTMRDARAKEVEEKRYIVAQLEERIRNFEKANPDALEESPWEKAIAAGEARIMMLEGPITLRASIDGFVSEVAFRAGDRVMAGVPIVSISALQSARILGFVRQPLTVVPKVGDKVQIRTRGVPRLTGIGEVTQVGAELRPLAAPVALPGSDLLPGTALAVERGLPFIITLPPDLGVFPGEIVDLHLMR